MNKLRIEFDWLERQLGSDLDRAFFANIGLAVGDEYVTRLDDLGAKTVRNHMRGSAWQLAMWFAANWWRLRWEPAPAKDTDWRLAHSLAAAGGGYVWPSAVFASDGDFVEVTATPDAKNVTFEPIRYINHVHSQITTGEFEQRVDEFMDAVISRLQSLGLKDGELTGLWGEIKAERNDPSTYRRRKLEAMAGFDPDEAPDGLLARLLGDGDRLGRSAIEELAAEARHAVIDTLEPIRELGRSQANPGTGGFRACVPQLDIPQTMVDDAGLPWQRGAKLARFARERWGFGKNPIKNDALAALLNTDSTVFTNRSTVGTQIPFAMRTGSNGTLDVYLDRPYSTSRRFAVSRLIGDHLFFAKQERLLPATRASTSRQKFQRAFAQEFLCPIEALVGKIQTRPDEDDISEAAEYFDVSPQMVRTTLVNNQVLDREALAWND